MAAKGDLSVTALYTSGVWTWGGLSYAHLYATSDSKRVFDATNAALALASLGKSTLRYALLHRHAMIDHLLETSPATQVIEIAAGLSRRGAAYSAMRRYTEIDLPSVISHKRALLERTPEGRVVLERLHLVGEDVETADLAAHRGPGPVLVIAEGLMMYLAGDARRRLFGKLRELGEVELVFDLVPTSEQPKPGLIGRALEAAMKQFTGGRTFERDAKTRAQLLDELRGAGFTEARAIAAADVARDWKLPHAEIRTDTVVFSARASAS